MVQRELNKWKVFLFLSLIVFTSFGNSDQKKETHNRLMEVNDNWGYLFDHIEHTFVPKNEQELVYLHLLNVISYLENQSTDHLIRKQNQNRARHISTLKKYAGAKQYPINNIVDYRTPIFIDSDNVHCAVGFLLKENGLNKVTREIADQQLLAYLNDIQHPQLSTWQKESGLSMFELTLIQPTYGPPIPVCAAPSPIEWSTVDSENIEITRLFNNNEATAIYGLSSINEIGNQQKIKSYSPTTQQWTHVGSAINGEILDLVFSDDQLYISVLLPEENSPYQLLKLNGRDWDKVAHFDGSIISIQSYQEKLYVLGNFKTVNDSINSSLITVKKETIEAFRPIGTTSNIYDQMQSSETALFFTSYGQIFKFKNDTINRIAGIQYYQHITDFSLDAWNDTLFVTSNSIQGYDSYSDGKERTGYLNNMLYGQDYPYSTINFTKSKKVNGKMVISGDFRSSTMIPQINDERVLIKCKESESSHWLGEGLLYEYGHTFYPILNQGIVLDFVQVSDQIYILKKDGSIHFTNLNEVELKIKNLVVGNRQ